MKTQIIKSHTSSQRDSWWFLEQDNNGSLWVSHKNDDDPEQGTTRWSINEALEKGIARTELQALVNRMFED